MLVAAAVCPQPPLLVPEVAAGAATELAPLRAACAAALARVATARPELLCVVGLAEDAVIGADFGLEGRDGRPEWYDAGSAGSFAPYGVAVDVVLGETGAQPTTGQHRLPLSLTVGAWLLRRAGWAGPVRGLAVPAGTPEPELSRCADLVADGADRVAVLVLGDGSARRSEKSPGYVDDRAAGFDEAAAAALAAGDPAALLAVDRGLGAELLAAGATPWRLLSYAADHATADGVASRWDAELHHDDAPYGVGYLVASWLRAGPAA